MKEPSGTRLPSDDDLALWRKVTRTAQPLSGRDSHVRKRAPRAEAPPPQAAESPSDSAPEEAQGKASPRPAASPNRPPPPPAPDRLHPFDRQTRRKLRKGTRSIGPRLDLHGMTQEQAHQALLGFLESAQRSGERIALVITGKGRDGGGVLRQSLPRWLEQGNFRALASGFEASHEKHGGEGAFYVQIRRSKQDSR